MTYTGRRRAEGLREGRQGRAGGQISDCITTQQSRLIHVGKHGARVAHHDIARVPVDDVPPDSLVAAVLVLGRRERQPSREHREKGDANGPNVRRRGAGAPLALDELGRHVHARAAQGGHHVLAHAERLIACGAGLQRAGAGGG